MKRTRRTFSFCSMLFLCLSSHVKSRADSILENREMRLVIADNGCARSLIHKQSGQECLVQNAEIPFLSLIQQRPYEAEIWLAYPHKATFFPVKSLRKEGDRLVASFALVDYEATVRVRLTDDYIGFTLERVSLSPEQPDLSAPLDELLFLQLPIRERARFGAWLNVVWDDQIAVNVLATDPYTRIDAQSGKGFRVLQAGAVERVATEGVGAALITTRTANLLDRIARVEEDFGLPKGVESRRRPDYKWSYYWTADITPDNVERHIQYARQGGFRTLVIYYPAFAKTAGHFPWRAEYPKGIEDLRLVVSKVEAAGLIPGLHFHYNKAHKTDAYVTPRPDPRLNLRRDFTLTAPINKVAAAITVEENPRGSVTREGQRILKLGEELISYESYTTTRPFQFLGCRRGELQTQPADHPGGLKFGLLDVDDWPIFVRFNQWTSIQEELAERLGRIYREAGFKFAYYDGAEDVHEPYWFTTSWAQFLVHRQLQPAPLFAEGAAKSHFSWHILTRANAYDPFPPELVREKTRKHPAPEAPMMADNLSGMNFGWMGYQLPSPKTIGMQPDIIEYVTSRAAAWDCPVSIQLNLRALDSHPRTQDNLEVLRRWEEVRVRNWLTETQKTELRDLSREHILLVNEKGDFELASCQEVEGAAGGDRSVRAFAFRRAGKSYIVYSHTSGEARLEVPVPSDQVRLMEQLGQAIPIERTGGGIFLPLGKRRYLESATLSLERLAAAFRRSRIR